MRRHRLLVALVLPLSIGMVPPGAAAGQLEVLHWWTSRGEANALAELQQRLAAAGHGWQDFAVAVGGGENAIIFLRSRVLAGHPPPAAQIKGADIQEWAAQGVLLDLDPIAKADHWDSALPAAVSRLLQYQGHYVAAPINIHRVNWMWVNPKIFQQAGATIPTTWEAFETAAQKIQKVGFIAVAHGGQPWQEATLFEAIALAVGGVDFYRRAFLELDLKALDSPPMAQAFETLRTVLRYADPAAPGRDWQAATGLLIQDKAAMQFMGDWVKGEFAAAGKVPGKDYLCLPMPGGQGGYIYTIDSFILFQTQNPEVRQAQLDMAQTIMEPALQQAFNLKKGSIPARMDIPMDAFDRCARQSKADFMQSAGADGLSPSMAHHMAVAAPVREAIYDVVTRFCNSTLSPADAAASVAQAVRENE